MVLAALRDLVFGPPAYKPETSWSAPGAIATATLIAAVAVAIGMLPLLLSWFVPASWGWVETVTRKTGPTTFSVSVSNKFPLLGCVLISQLVLTVLTLWAARKGGGIVQVLAMRQPKAGVSAYLLALLTFAGLFGLQLLVSWLYPSLDKEGEVFLAGIIKNSGWWLAVGAIIIGAPIAEELYFRGYLLPAIAQTRLGFWGAALVTSLEFAVVHAQYSPGGIAFIGLIGICLCWILRRTGSLLLTILVHALNNATALAVFALTSHV